MRDGGYLTCDECIRLKARIEELETELATKRKKWLSDFKIQNDEICRLNDELAEAKEEIEILERRSQFFLKEIKRYADKLDAKLRKVTEDLREHKEEVDA